MNFIISLVGIAVVFVLAYLVSNNKKQIKYKPILIMLVLQVVLTFILLNTGVGLFVIEGISATFTKLLEYAAAGINFVFGGMANPDENPPFFLTVLLPIVFISALIGIAQYIKVLPFIIKYLGLVLSKINGLGKLESFNAVASAIFGQSEVFISVKKQLGHLPDHRLYTLCTSAMSTVSASILGAYMTMIDPKYVIVALVLNLFGGFIIVNILNPYEVTEEEDFVEVEEGEKQTFFEMLGEYIMDGFKVAIIVGAMLIGFVAIIAAINGLFDMIFGITFQTMLGYVFAPFAFIIGIPMNEVVPAGTIMATKLVSNEFVAMLDLSNMKGLSERTTAIISVFLVSFANFSSIGIITGAVKGLHEQKGNVVARFGLKLLFGATLVSFLSAAIVGLLI
ncbi:NupC/NupG family nucleoside CNT transporter [Bacillus mangrovi]|uniref:NupC/NupG family nucleoside CNT transporter n=1 Tax=Metabacillus mangrovi TaxID=1491830 RepID=A0A7X2S4C9_9BACI|nr:nucleoside transporter C-terminal domain-containing protein [Metabacillus mangrovi]MTH53402.1 NupC/NupG family nucleoside CNT transporter [Metabacillus mangrovi]